MKVSVVMSREPTYVRNKMILDCLNANGVRVTPYVHNGSSYPVRFLNVLASFILRPTPDADAVFVGFFGQPFVPFMRVLTRKPIVLDAFISTYDTMCFDRKRCKPQSLPGKFFFWLDRFACDQAALILLDTNEHIKYFARTFDIPQDKFRRVFVGADDNLFKPLESGKKDKSFRVFYYCTYRPLHGAEHVVRAAHLLCKQQDIKFTMVGGGQQRAHIDELASELGVSNIDFVDWVDYSELPRTIAQADVCLGGHFSSIDKAKRVIAGKSFQFIAMRKAAIVGDNPANREFFTDRKDAWFVKMGDPEDLSEAILILKENPELRERIAENGYRSFLRGGSKNVIAEELEGIMRECQSRNAVTR